MAYEQNGRGEIANLILHAHLIKEGYQVFVEDGSQGPIDMVAVDLETGNVRYFDVKCQSRRRDGSTVNRTLKERQRALEIRGGIVIELAYVDTDTYEVRIPKRRATYPKQEELQKKFG